MSAEKWSKQEIWVARGENGQILRVSEVSPEELLKEADRLRELAK